MRFVRFTGIATLLAAGCGVVMPGSLFAASREQQEMQRDIAQLQDQVRTLQSGFDQKMAALQTLVQQALDASNKANTTVSVLSAGLSQTLEREVQSLDREIKEGFRPAANVSAKVDNVSNDTAELRNSVADLTMQLNRMQQQLTDINNAIKVIQAPAAPPPSSPGAQAQASGATPVGPPAQTLYTNATNDMSSGKADLAAGEFADFVRFYPDDPNAPYAQFYIGQIHYSQGKLEQAVMDFDAVLERFPENKMTADAYFMKGKALVQSGHRDAGASEFRALIRKYPRSDRAPQATQQLRAMGLSPTSSGTGTAKKKATTGP
jgi:TolA-binding protein